MENIYQILELQKKGNVYSCISSTLKWMPSKTLTRSLFGGICFYGLFPFCKKEGLKVCRVLYYEPFRMEEKTALKGPLYKIRGEDLDLKLFLCKAGKLHIFFAHIIVAFIFLVLLCVLRDTAFLAKAVQFTEEGLSSLFLIVFHTAADTNLKALI